MKSRKSNSSAQISLFVLLHSFSDEWKRLIRICACQRRNSFQHKKTKKQTQSANNWNWNLIKKSPDKNWNGASQNLQHKQQQQQTSIQTAPPVQARWLCAVFMHVYMYTYVCVWLYSPFKSRTSERHQNTLNSSAKLQKNTKCAKFAFIQINIWKSQTKWQATQRLGCMFAFGKLARTLSGAAVVALEWSVLTNSLIHTYTYFLTLRYVNLHAVKALESRLVSFLLS